LLEGTQLPNKAKIVLVGEPNLFLATLLSLSGHFSFIQSNHSKLLNDWFQDVFKVQKSHL
jgi:hypothetical protein